MFDPTVHRACGALLGEQTQMQLRDGGSVSFVESMDYWSRETGKAVATP